MGGSSQQQPDWKALQERVGTAATQQTAANRPTINTPFAQQSWQKDPATGEWTMGNNLSGGLGTAAQAALGQAGALATPMDWSKIAPGLTGDQARSQAIAGATGRASGMLDPMWADREAQTRARMLGQGVAEDSPQMRAALATFGDQKADAYKQAGYSAVGQGASAGDSLFKNSQLARQMGIADALRERSTSLDDMSKLNGFLDMPGFGQDTATLAGAQQQADVVLAGAQADSADRMRAQAAIADSLRAGGDAAASVIGYYRPRPKGR